MENAVPAAQTILERLLNDPAITGALQAGAPAPKHFGLLPGKVRERFGTIGGIEAFEEMDPHERAYVTTQPPRSQRRQVRAVDTPFRGT